MYMEACVRALVSRDSDRAPGAVPMHRIKVNYQRTQGNR